MFSNSLIGQLSVVHAELLKSNKSEIPLHFIIQRDEFGLTLLVVAPRSVSKKLESLVMLLDRATIWSTLLFEDLLADLDELAIHEDIS